MHFLKNLIVTFIGFLLITSCSQNDYKFKLETEPKVTLGGESHFYFKQLEGEKYDSIHFYINNTKLSAEHSQTINTATLGTGKHTITALVFVPNQVQKITTTIEVLSNISPSVYTYTIKNTYPHDPKAYTQGLEYHNGFLYETTGRKGESWLRKVQLETGEVVLQEDLSDAYFGEGMTVFNDEVLWLTWQANKGFTYNVNDFKQTGSFDYENSFEGWGLTHNSTELIKSDGTNKIWFLDPITKKEKRHIQAYTNKIPVDDLNELELINGKIYANKWQKNSIVIINPKNGVIEGVADLNGLKDIVAKDQKLNKNDDVLNGIAFDATNNRLFVTGKHWGKLFEIELTQK